MVRGEVPADNEVGRWFQARAIANGIPPQAAAELWKEVFAFASFGFCKSHAAAFALPTYLSSWLKARYPAEFYAGLLTHDPGMYPRRLIVADARQFGIPVHPIDINRSDKVYRAEDGGVRLAFSEVREISEVEVDSILDARADHEFRSLEDLWRRTELSRPVLENLVHIGALDSVSGGRARRELLWRAIDLSGGGTQMTASRRKARPHKVTGAVQLGLQLNESIMEALPGLPPYTPLEETEAELEVGGIDARRHMMSLYAPLLAETGCIPADRLVEQRNDAVVWVAGVKVASQTPAIRSGKRIIFVTLDDLTGPIDVTVFERVQHRVAQTVFHSWLLLVRGILRKRGGASRVHRTDPRNVGITIVADEVFDLAELAKDRAAGHPLQMCLGRQRKRQAAGGLGGASDAAPTRLWHASGGSAGR